MPPDKLNPEQVQLLIGHHPDEPPDTLSPEQVKSLTNAANISPWETALRRGAQGATLGFEDEAVGAGKAGLGLLTGDVKLQDLLSKYRQYRDAERIRNQQATDANPKTALAAELVGGGLTTLYPGSLSLKGAIAGLGYSNADLTKGEVLPAAVSTGIGALIGAAPDVLRRAIPAAVSTAANSPSTITRGLGALLGFKGGGPMGAIAGGTISDNVLKPAEGPIQRGAQALISKFAAPTGATSQASGLLDQFGKAAMTEVPGSAGGSFYNIGQYLDKIAKVAGHAVTPKSVQQYVSPKEAQDLYLSQ